MSHVLDTILVVEMREGREVPKVRDSNALEDDLWVFSQVGRNVTDEFDW